MARLSSGDRAIFRHLTGNSQVNYELAVNLILFITNPQGANYHDQKHEIEMEDYADSGNRYSSYSGNDPIPTKHIQQRNAQRCRTTQPQNG